MLNKLNKLLENKWFPISFRIITLIAFLGLVIIGFSSPTKDPFFVSQLSKTNLTTSFVWRLWWPIIVLSAIFLGRVWCMVCPVELVSTFFAKIGLKLKRPKWILSGWVITLFYMFVLTLGVTILQIDLNPAYTSYYLMIIMGTSIVSGLVFEKNTFCRYICPVGYLLGVFSKMAIWGWRVKKESVCAACKDKSCISSRYTYQLNYKSCGVDLVPSEINNNSHCLLCAGCLKTCKTYNTDNNSSRPNPAIVKTGLANDLLQLQPLRLAEWVFLFFLTGSMFFEMTHFQIISDISTSLITKNISVYLGFNEGTGKDMIGVVYLFLLLPAILWILPFMLARAFGFQISLSTYLKNISLIFLPVIAAFFVGLVIMEIVTKFPYYKYMLHDVKGVETIKAMLFRQIEMPLLPSWTDYAFLIILIIALAAGTFISFRVTHKLITKTDIKRNATLIYILPILFIIIIIADALLYKFF